MLIDYHIHTTFSGGAGSLTTYIKKADERKADEIGFSDHIHFKKGSWSMVAADLPNYVDKITSLRTVSPVSVKMGLEVDFVPSEVDKLMRAINEFGFDYIIGSVHYIDDWLINAERQIEEWKRRDVDEVCQQYYALIQEMAKTRLFDIIGHLDLVKRFGFRPRNDLTSLLLETVEMINQNQMCVEVNTSGLKDPCNEIYPSEKLLRMCFDHGVTVTLGSDAHSPQDVAADSGKAISLLRKIGYVETVRFTRRKRELVNLSE
jgi:histidinol-phosphatase (PHP family)